MVLNFFGPVHVMSMVSRMVAKRIVKICESSSFNQWQVRTLDVWNVKLLCSWWVISIDLARKAITPASASPKKLLRGWEHLRWWPPFTGTLERVQQKMVNMSCYILSHAILWLSLCFGVSRVPESPRKEIWCDWRPKSRSILSEANLRITNSFKLLY